MDLFDGLLGYEIVMLILGVVFFLALLVVFIIRSVRNQSIKVLFAFFILPIIMIGYPSIEKISIGKDLVDIEKSIDRLEKNPNDEKAKTELSKKLKEIGYREFTSPQNAVGIAKAHKALGNETKAKSILNKVVKQHPKDPQAIKLLKDIGP